MSKRLLFITSTRIGDAVLSTSLLDYLIRTNPGIRVTISCGKQSAGLFVNVPGLEQLIIVDKQPYHLHWLKLWTKTARTRWDILVDLRVSVMSWFLLAKNRYWLVSTSGKNPDHRVVRMGQLLNLYPPPYPRLWLNDANRAKADALLSDNRAVLAVAPFANSEGKIWPVDRYTSLLRRLSAPGAPFENARIILLGSEAEKTRAKPLFEAFDKNRLIDGFGWDNLLDVQAVLERSALFIGNDSGLMHMAAAASIPTLGLFGPTRHWLYAPFGPKTLLVRESGIIEQKPWESFSLTSLPEGMEGLDVDLVEKAVYRLLARVEVESL